MLSVLLKTLLAPLVWARATPADAHRYRVIPLPNTVGFLQSWTHNDHTSQGFHPLDIYFRDMRTNRHTQMFIKILSLNGSRLETNQTSLNGRTR